MRQFIARSFPDRVGVLKITGKDFRYFYQVLRVKIGDMIQVRLPDGSLCNMTVCRRIGNRDELELQVCDEQSGIERKTVTRGTTASEIDVPSDSIEYWLFQFVAQSQRMDMIIRQAAECGVKGIIPVIGDYSQTGNVTAAAQRKDRGLRIIREARQQSGSAVSTEYFDPSDIQAAVALWKKKYPPENCAGVVLYERTVDTKPLRSVLQRVPDLRSVALVVGCEGGISPADIELLKKNGFIPVHLDTNILRCETAALYGIAVLQSAIGEIRQCH